MSASEKHEKNAKPVINDSPTVISTSPNENTYICKDGRDIMCQIHGG